MPTPSQHLSLLKPSTSDTFVTQDIANNWGKLDAAPGSFICTSSTRPTWSTNQTGMKIFETDTGLEWWWNGTGWRRMGPSGMLKTSAGQPAIALLTSNVSNSDAAHFSLVVAVSSVVVPDGNRPLRIVASWKNAAAGHGLSLGAIFRSAVADTGQVLGTWQMAGDSTNPISGSQGQGGSYTAYERTGLSPGSYAWSFQFRVAAAGGPTTATLFNDTAGGVCSIAVMEE
jgi:hypothetical protein